MLKGRYYHDSEFLECTRKRRASLTWRAILAGRDVLKKGLIRRIGDGSHTRIWEDRWIPQHFDGKPIVPQEGHVLTHVDQLISESGQWNEDVVRMSFSGIDADAILRTPIGGRGEDIWAWEPERHGFYSVKSAYKLLDATKQQLQDEAAVGSSGDDTWRRIWKLAPRSGGRWLG